MLCAIIMAGGVGTRFWPQSTEKKPKQFLKLLNDKTMIQMTYERINKVVDKDHIFIATNEKYTDLVKEQIEGINDKNIILEPSSKNTAPCILLSSLYIKELYGDANIVCISSDNLVLDEKKFAEDIITADSFIKDNKEAIITIGIKPNRPETGYGYIKINDDSNPVIKVDKFVEKPDLDTAKKYLADGNYLWNAGMFIFNNISMLNELEKNMTNNYKLLSTLPNYEYTDLLKSKYNECEKISIDYAVMEKSNNVYTIKTDFGWDDVGTWKSLERYLNKDENNNILKGDIECIDSKNNIVYANGKKIIIMDLDNIFCIDSDDVIVIGKKEDISKVHELRKKSN